jgi:hypothetical protein
MFLLLAVATFLICSVLLTLPKAKGCSGCLFDLLRFVALVAGALAALIILFGSGQELSVLFEGDSTGITVLRIASIFLTIVFGACALALVAHAWQMLMGRQHRIDDDADLSEFDPTDFLFTGSSSSLDADDFGGCLFAIAATILVALFWIGIKLSGLIARLLMPSAKTARTRRAFLSFIYGIVLFGLIIAALSAVFGLNPIRGGNLDDSARVGMAEIQR